MAKPLDGVRVLEFGILIAGPYCSTLLGEMGAEVIRVERPGGEYDRMWGPVAASGLSMPFMNVARGKKGITLNVRSDEGVALLNELVKRSDIVVQNFPRSVAKKTGVDYDSLKAINPAIIVVCISGFGYSGPYAEHVCLDTIAQSMSGGMSITGYPGTPPTRSAVPYVDFGTAMNAALGAMFALYHRERTGQGQMVDVSLLDTAVSMMASWGVPAEHTLTGKVRSQQGNHSFYNPSNSYQARDGWVFIAPAVQRRHGDLLRAMGREDLADDEEFQERYNREMMFYNNDIMEPIIREWVAQQSVDDVVRLGQELRMPVAPVHTIADMVKNPQVHARQMLVDFDYPDVGPVPLCGVTIKLSETPGSTERRAPMMGEHNEEIYQGLLGLSAGEVASLKEKGVI